MSGASSVMVITTWWSRRRRTCSTALFSSATVLSCMRILTWSTTTCLGTQLGNWLPLACTRKCWKRGTNWWNKEKQFKWEEYTSNCWSNCTLIECGCYTIITFMGYLIIIINSLREGCIVDSSTEISWSHGKLCAVWKNIIENWFSSIK